MPVRPRPVLATLGAVALGGLLLSPSGPASAGPVLGARATSTDAELAPSDGDVLTEVAEARGAAPVRRAAVLGCFTAPAGDVVDLQTGQPATYPPADLVEYCVDNRATITVSARTAEPTPPPSDPGSTTYSSVQWALDVNDDEMPEYLVSAEQGGAGVVDVRDEGGDVEPFCDAEYRFDGSRHIVSFPSRCLGSPDAVRAAASVIIAPQSDLPEGPAYADGTDFSSPVVRTGPVVGTRRDSARLAGGDRYATAVAVSQEAYPQGAGTAYIARGDVPSPDALVGGTLTDGPVLLVPQCGALPASVREEIRRLAPRRVVGLGGAAAVCDALLAEAANA